LLAHGAGSSAEFVGRAFAGPLAAAGYRLACWDQRGSDVDEDFAAAAHASGALLVGGVSRGAHAAARWASGRDGLEGVLLVMPAWTGPAGPVAAGSARSAEEIDRDGLRAVLQRLEREQPGWVADELVRAWPAYGDALTRALREASTAGGPTPRELTSIRVPVGLVALADDALHPEQVAQTWLKLLSRAALRLLDAQAPAVDRSVLGWKAMAAWQQARHARDAT
jgi:pimeloyl-ACP methyl ester carboxylesterase